MPKHSPSKSPTNRSAQTKGFSWSKLRLVILAFNFLFIINCMVFDRKTKDDNANSNDLPKAFYTVVEHHEGKLLAECKEDQFNLKNERQRKHKSPFEYMCSKLPSQGASAASLWDDYAETIFQASIHPLDTKGGHVPWTKSLFKFVTPYLLEKGLRASPQHSNMQTVMRIIQTKLQHPDTAPPLEVLIVGGSVTEGGGCENTHNALKLNVSNAEKKDFLGSIKGNACAWPFRLQVLVDAMLGSGVIRFHNLAVGGTNSHLALPVLDYWLFPEGSVLLERGPDVIINGYAANDNLPPENKRGDDTNVTGDYDFFYKYGLEQEQDFIRACLQSRPCFGEPLVFFVDEYLGNQHDIVLGELFRFEAVDLLADWYGSVGAISSAEVVRRFVYANTDDVVFSARWKAVFGTHERRIDVHAGMASHVLIAWTTALSMLTMALNFCEEEVARRGDAFNEGESGGEERQQTTYAKFVDSESMELLQHAIPPILDKELQVSDVKTRWSADALARAQAVAEYCEKSPAAGENSTAIDDSPKQPCSFAFVAAPMGTARSVPALNNYVNKFLLNNNGWMGQSGMCLKLYFTVSFCCYHQL